MNSKCSKFFRKICRNKRILRHFISFVISFGCLSHNVLFYHYFSVPFDCVDKQDGYYPNSSDCAKYYSCSGGTTKELACPPSLLFSETIKTCDWPANVEC